jgi:hypothetical protein
MHGHTYHYNYTLFQPIKSERDIAFDNMVTFILSDFELFKYVLNHAAENYLQKMEHNFFHNGGKQRAKNLRQQLSTSKNQYDLIEALANACKSGNSDENSLITYLWKGLYNTFHLERSITQLGTAYAYHMLDKLIKDAREKLLDLTIAQATSLPLDVAKVATGYYK